MTRLRLVAFASVTLSLVASGSLVACSDDTSIDPKPDGGIDSAVPDTGAGDSEVPDTGTPDTGADTGVPLSLSNLADVVSQHMCGSFARCCYGTATPADGGLDGGGSFDRTSCLNLYKQLGFENSNVGYEAYAGGKVTLDPAKAAACIAKIDAMTCNISFTEFAEIRSTCFGAVAGSVAAGAACAESVECASGLFCKPTAVGSLAGTCTALKTAGELCSDFAGQGGASEDRDVTIAHEACSYRGSGTPNLYCNSYDFTLQVYPPEAAWTCQAGVANGEHCSDSTWCANGLCDPDNDYVCVDPFKFFTASNCAGKIIP